MSRTRQIAIVAGIVSGVGGAWAFFAPESFYGFATYPPYSRHFIHDLGAFQIGVAAVLLLAAFRRGALYVALAGTAAGAWVHVASHAIDRSIGQDGTRDLVFTTLFALLVTAGAVAAGKEER